MSQSIDCVSLNLGSRLNNSQDDVHSEVVASTWQGLRSEKIWNVKGWKIARVVGGMTPKWEHCFLKRHTSDGLLWATSCLWIQVKAGTCCDWQSPSGMNRCWRQEGNEYNNYVQSYFNFLWVSIAILETWNACLHSLLGILTQLCTPFSQFLLEFGHEVTSENLPMNKISCGLRVQYLFPREKHKVTGGKQNGFCASKLKNHLIWHTRSNERLFFGRQIS